MSLESISAGFSLFAKSIYGHVYGDAKNRRTLVTKFNHINEHTFMDNNRKISYMTSEKTVDSDPIIFLHGTPGNALAWQYYLENPGKYKVIALDRPGFGPSDSQTPDLDNDMALIEKVLEKETANKKAIIVGSSLGGGVATRLAVDNPDKVKALFLMASAVDPNLEPEIQAVQKIAHQQPVRGILNYLFHAVYSSNEELLNYKSFLENLSERIDTNSGTFPIFCMHTKDDTLVPFENTQYVKNKFPNSTVNIISYDIGGHSFPRKNTADFQNLLASLPLEYI